MAKEERADARRNRERLLTAASRLFAQHGPDVPYLDIAKAAGVGVGTVYRHFPARGELVEAAYRVELDGIVDVAAELLASLPPEQALRMWMDRFTDYMTTRLGRGEAIRAVVAAGGNPFAHSRERLDVALEILLGATAKAGVTRPDILANDVLMSLSGIAMVASGPGQREQAGRMLDLLYAGLQARLPAL